MFKTNKFLSLASLLGAGMLAVSGGNASATLLSPIHQAAPAPATTGEGLLIEAQTAANRHARSGRRWNSRHHGPRCRYRGGNCNYYRQGYYYANPWWLVAPVVGAVIIGSSSDGYRHNGGNRHVQWCANRYRSYNVRYNTWVAYSGQVHQCRSPY